MLKLINPTELSQQAFRQKSRTILYIVVHCTAGNVNASIVDVLDVFKRKGWKRPGYHFVITKDGKIWQLVSTSCYSNGVKNHNFHSINISYTGGVNQDDMRTPSDTRTEAQKLSLVALLKKLRKDYPNAKILGHCDFPEVKKACPSFNAKKEYSNL